MPPMSKSPSIRKWITRCAAAAALILIVTLVAVHQLHPQGIWMGKPLLPGKVRPQLVNAGDTAELLAPDGSLWAWGGTYSSLTNMFPQPVISQVPLRLGSDTDWTQIACGTEHTVALKNDGSLWAWGANRFGQIGQANVARHYGIPTRIGTETNWTQVCANRYRNLALKNDGSLWAWGLNNSGQLGDGTTQNRSIPTLIGADRDWRTISSSDYTSFALKNNGTLWAWGFGISERTPTKIDSAANWRAISARGNTLLACKNDGTLWLISEGTIYFDFKAIGRDKDWAEVYNSSFARKKDNSWWACPENQWSRLGKAIGITELPSPDRLPFDSESWAFAPRQRTSLLLGRDGKLWTWGQRMGADKPSTARQRFEAFVASAVRRFPSLSFLIKSDIDEKPHLLWKLPPEVRRSLGTHSKGSTNDLTDGHPPDVSHE
jgi:alpha-tubulin suppressor-like RCC1 family protein